MYNETIAADIRIVAITSTTTATLITELLRAAYAAKTPPIAFPFDKKETIRMALTPSADVVLSDITNSTPDTITISSGTRYVVDLLNAYDKLLIKNSATVKVELFLGK